MNILQSIMAQRRLDVDAAKAAVPVERLRDRAGCRQHRSLRDRLVRGAAGTSIIAELKKASPSAGVIRPDYRPADIALSYAKAGAVGISVLTEPHRFLGSEEHFRQVREAVDLPLLRKDFMCDVYQICESAAWGADVILLIVAALSAQELKTLNDAALKLGLEVLVEAHTEDELDLALSLEGAIVGVNSRDLKTLKTDLAVARRLASAIPTERVSIAESGIRTRDEVLALQAAGYKGFLVGESLMSNDDPGVKLRELMQ